MALLLWPLLMYLDQFNEHYNVILASVYRYMCVYACVCSCECVYMCTSMEFEISKIAIPLNLKSEVEVHSFVGFDGFIIFSFEG